MHKTAVSSYGGKTQRSGIEISKLCFNARNACLFALALARYIGNIPHNKRPTFA